MADTRPFRTAPSSALSRALAWLGSPPHDDPLRDLAPLRSHVVSVARARINPIQRCKILELLQTRLGYTASTVKPLLLDATLPLAKRLRTVAHALMDIHGEIAQACLDAMRCTAPGVLDDAGFGRARLCSWGLGNLMQKYEIAQFVSGPLPTGFWAQALALFRLAPAAGGAVAADAQRRLKTILALSAAQPETLTPRETAFLSEYLRLWADSVEILPSESGVGPGCYWLDETQSDPPMAAARRLPGGEPSLLFSCRALSRMAVGHLTRLADGESVESVGLPGSASAADYRDVLARAARRWDNPPRRQTRRRKYGARVQVCSPLGTLWQALRNDGSPAPAKELPTSDWMVLNESANGYAIMHVAGALAGLIAGGAIGLRASGVPYWSICVVRWARSDNPEHIELGLELLATSAKAVRITRAQADGQQLQVPALLLPPLPLLGRGEALLTARGTFERGRFTLVDDSDQRLQVTECRSGEISMQTACVEVFGFERSRD